MVPSLKGPGVRTGVNVAGWKVLELGTFRHHRLHFRPYKDRSIVPPSKVKRRDADMVPTNEKEVFGAIVEDEGEHPAELLGQFNSRTVLSVER